MYMFLKRLNLLTYILVKYIIKLNKNNFSSWFKKLQYTESTTKLGSNFFIKSDEYQVEAFALIKTKNSLGKRRNLLFNNSAYMYLSMRFISGLPIEIGSRSQWSQGERHRITDRCNLQIFAN